MKNCGVLILERWLLNKMAFIEGSRGVYKPIKVMFDTPIYERALQTCWHMGSYKSQIALVSELLRLQQKKQLPSEVTAEDMTQFLVEESKRTLRVQLWEFGLEDYDTEVRPLLKLVWEVNTSMKMRDVEFEARRLLTSPDDAPPQFKHPKILSKAQMYAGNLTEQQQEARGPKQLSPREVVIEVVPKVLQGFWLPPPNTSFNMPSKQLCKMAVGVTKAVEDRVSTALSAILCQVPFSHSIRDNLVLSIQEKIRQSDTTDVLVKKLNCFATEVLNTIADVAAGEICALFKPQTHTAVSSIQPADMVDDAEVKTSPAEDVDEQPGLEEDTELITEPPANTGFSETTEQPTHCLKLKSVVTPASPLPVSPPAEVIPSVLDPKHRGKEPTKEPEAVVAATPHPAEVSSSVLDAQNKIEEPIRDPDSAVVLGPPSPVTPPAEVTSSVLNAKNEIKEPTRDPASAVVAATPPPAEVTSSVLDTKNETKEPTRDPASAFVAATPPPAEVTSSVLDARNEIEEPIRDPDSAVVSTPPPPVSPPAEVIPSVLDTEHRGEEPTRDPDSAAVPSPPTPVTPPAEVTPPAVVILSVQDPEHRGEEPTRDPDPAVAKTPSPPAEVTSSVLDAKKKIKEPIRDPASVAVPAPPSPLTPPAEVTSLVLDTENEIKEHTRDPDSIVVSTPPPPMSPPVVLISSVLDTEHRGEEPTRDPDSAAVPAPPATVTPPAEITSSVLDAKNETKEPTRDPDSVVVSTPPPPVSPPAEVIPSVLDTEHRGEEPTRDPDSAAVLAPPTPVTPTAEVTSSVLDAKNETEEPTRDPDSAVATTPPPPLTPADEPPVISEVQDELIITEQPFRVDESFCTATGVKKTKRSGFRRFFRWLRKNTCCCFRPQNETEME
ncbi:hypothetical protein L3Q82_001706 [Scortum barcoo]|uniref:Uncharacterized protein n=1 Tax=Scortum barcoo TaxID=214431 RepID=A0ACB8W4B6_9TELE|nr:hypothetical protein L3Q82_001706 [Scortum barcoo]